MAYPVGKPSTEISPGVWQGTTPEGLQRWLGSMFTASGWIPGRHTGKVSGTTSWSYAYEPGAAMMWASWNGGAGLIVPIEAGVVPTSPAPSSGSRSDVVYVDSKGVVRVAQGATSAPEGVVLDRFVVPAGATNTNGATSNYDRTFAIPAGASLGRLHRFHDPANEIFGNVAAMTLGTGRFSLPSDRLVRFDLTHCISAEQDANPATGEATVMRWRVYIDNKLEVAFTTRAEWDNPQTNFMSFTKELAEGAHTVHYVQDRLKGARFKHHKGTAAAYAGNRFEVWDAGVSR